MRIGLVTGEYPPMKGGVGAYTCILAQEFVRQGHSVCVLSSEKATSNDAGIELDNSIRAWGPGSLRTVARWAHKRRLDVVSLQYQTAAYQMSPWIHFMPSVIRCIPVVTTFHDLRYPYLFPKAGRLRDWIVMGLARASEGVIVTNHEDGQRLQHLPNVKLIPIDSNILRPLPDDFDASSWREKAGAGCDDYLLGYFGLINRSKGLETLLESISRLRREGIPARLVLIGDAGSSDPTNVAYAGEIEAKIRNLQLEGYICRTGFLEHDEEVAGYLNASDAVVLPYLDGASYRRGSLMAAIRYACPIVTTRPQVEIPAFVHGESMQFVEPGNSDALADALRALYHAPELRQRLRRGVAALAQHFEWPQIAADYTNFFSWVIESVQ